jgi:hypothetical protein
MDGVGKPVPDARRRGTGLVRELSAKDFPETGARLAGDGTISPPTE